MVPGEPSNSTRVLASDVPRGKPVEVRVAGPRLEPNRTSNSPGATGLGWKDAALVTAATIGLATTFTVIGIVTGGLELEGSETVTVAEYVPGVNPIGLTVTFKVAGVRAVNAVTDNQLEADAGLMEVLKPIGGPLVNDTVSGVGVNPVWTLNDRAVGFTASIAPPVTVNVTGMERVAPTEGTIATLPVYTPATNPEAFAVTVTLAGVSATVGVTDSQPVPLTVEAAVVKWAAPVEAIVNVCWPVLFTPAVLKLNDRAVGVEITKGAAVTVNVTGI